MENGIILDMQSNFGNLQEKLYKNCFFINEDMILYISGRHFVYYDIVSKK